MKKTLLWTLSLIMACLPCLGHACQYARAVGEDFSCAVEACAPVADDYFADCLLIGDSIAAGLDDYNLFPTLYIACVIGMSPNAAITRRKVFYEGENISMVELAKRRQPKCLFVMLGSNGLDTMNSEIIAGDYHRLLDALLQALPDTDIYLFAVTPVCEANAKKDYPTFSNKRIRNFNDRLAAMAQEHGVYVIDCFTPLLNQQQSDAEKGYLASDGIHLTRKGAEHIAQIIRTHIKQ